MSLLAQVVPDLWEMDRDEAWQALQQIRDLTRGALAEMRALLFELRPADATEQSRVQALRQHAAAFERRTGCKVVVEAEDYTALPAEVTHTLLRIAQETLTNVSRHAQAQQVHLSLQGKQPVRLHIADDGRGFDPGHVKDTSFGLMTMRERAAKINARFLVRSAPGQGTEIIVEWPDLDNG
jgi:signal transduction histidine kinase